MINNSKAAGKCGGSIGQMMGAAFLCSLFRLSLLGIFLTSHNKSKSKKDLFNVVKGIGRRGLESKSKGKARNSKRPAQCEPEKINSTN